MTAGTPWLPHGFAHYPEGHPQRTGQGCAKCGLTLERGNHAANGTPPDVVVNQTHCASCGLRFEDRELKPREHATTPRGPMHFRCYFEAKRVATREAGLR